MAKILIDNVPYELDFDFDIGEARLIKRYASITLNELKDHDESDPDLVAAFIHIAFKRQSPEVSDKLIEERVNRVKLASIDMRDDEVVQDPPAPALVPSSSDNSSGASSSNGAVHTPEIVSPEISGHPA